MTSIAISGASGKLGQLVLRSLRAITHHPLVLLSRTPNAPAEISSDLESRFADFDQIASLEGAMSGIDRLILISTNALDPDGRRIRQHRTAIDAAIGAGVSHIVYTSFLKADTSPLSALTADHAATEVMLTESGVGYSVLRYAFYDDLALQVLGRADDDGRFFHAAGTGGVAYVTRQQCADAAAVAITDGFSGRRTLDITGPRVITMPELAELARRSRGRPYLAVHVSKEALIERLVASKVPLKVAALLAWIDDGLARGAGGPASRDFERLTGSRAQILRCKQLGRLSPGWPSPQIAHRVDLHRFDDRLPASLQGRTSSLVTRRLPRPASEPAVGRPAMSASGAKRTQPDGDQEQTGPGAAGGGTSGSWAVTCRAISGGTARFPAHR